MKNLFVLVLLILIVAVMVIHFISFQVRETEVALVIRLGEPVRTKVEPGWYRKLPDPIEKVHKYDSRAHLFEGIMEETTTRGGEPIIVTSYVVWKIENPLKFLESVQDKTGAEEKLRSLLRNSQNTVIGQHFFSEFVNSDPEKIHFEEIENEMLVSMQDQASENYGISVKMVGIKQLGVNEMVTKEVFERMKADRQRKADAIITEGQAQATMIRKDAESKRTQLMAIVEAQANAIRGKGDAEAAKYYKMLEADPDLAKFLRDTEALKKILKEKTTIILGTETDPMQLLKGVPDIKPKSK